LIFNRKKLKIKIIKKRKNINGRDDYPKRNFEIAEITIPNKIQIYLRKKNILSEVSRDTPAYKDILKTPQLEHPESNGQLL
jgi:hypothetical protein